MSKMQTKTNAALCYVLLWVSGLFFFLTSKDRLVRFHALQSIVIFGVLHLLTLIPLIGTFLSPVVIIIGFILWLVLIFKAYQGEEFFLPYLSEWVKNKVK